MIRNLVALLIGVALLAILVAGGALIADRVLTSPAEQDIRAAFRLVEPGMSEARVLELLGPTAERSNQFYLAQRDGYERAYRRAAQSGSSYFLVWRGSDAVYSVGFDGDGEVTIAEAGGT